MDELVYTNIYKSKSTESLTDHEISRTPERLIMNIGTQLRPQTLTIKWVCKVQLQSLSCFLLSFTLVLRKTGVIARPPTEPR